VFEEWWDILLLLCYKFIAKSVSERILKIGQYLAGKDGGKNRVAPFLLHTVYVPNLLPASRHWSNDMR